MPVLGCWCSSKRLLSASSSFDPWEVRVVTRLAMQEVKTEVRWYLELLLEVSNFGTVTVN